uniref:Uncharacterized protein n=1 Tax=Anopheles coluzzii TaxID=1518534 RepID=A0A8W7PIR4_ANOCL
MPSRPTPHSATVMPNRALSAGPPFRKTGSSFFAWNVSIFLRNDSGSLSEIITGGSGWCAKPACAHSSLGGFGGSGEVLEKGPVPMAFTAWMRSLYVVSGCSSPISSMLLQLDRPAVLAGVVVGALAAAWFCPLPPLAEWAGLAAATALPNLLSTKFVAADGSSSASVDAALPTDASSSSSSSSSSYSSS